MKKLVARVTSYRIIFSGVLIEILTLCRGTAGILLVLPRYCLGPGPRDPVGPAGLVGLGPPGLAPGLKWDEADTAPGLIAGVLVGLLGEGDKWPQGPVSACRNLLSEWEEFSIRIVLHVDFYIIRGTSCINDIHNVQVLLGGQIRDFHLLSFGKWGRK